VSNIGNKKALVEAKKLFRIRVNHGWGYLVRKRKSTESSLREKKIEKACRIYWRGIERAWDIYTEDNTLAKQAKEALEESKNQANKLYLQEDSNYSPKHFLKAMYRAHDEFADKVVMLFKEFMHDMRRYDKWKQ